MLVLWVDNHYQTNIKTQRIEFSFLISLCSIIFSVFVVETGNVYLDEQCGSPDLFVIILIKEKWLGWITLALFLKQCYSLSLLNIESSLNVKNRLTTFLW